MNRDKLDNSFKNIFKILNFQNKFSAVIVPQIRYENLKLLILFTFWYLYLVNQFQVLKVIFFGFYELSHDWIKFWRIWAFCLIIFKILILKMELNLHFYNWLLLIQFSPTRMMKLRQPSYISPQVLWHSLWFPFYWSLDLRIVGIFWSFRLCIQINQ